MLIVKLCWILRMSKINLSALSYKLPFFCPIFDAGVGLCKSKFSSSSCLCFSSVQSLNRVWLFVTLWSAAHQAYLSITNSQSLIKLMSIESVMPFNHPILCHPLLFLLSIFPSIRVFSYESGSQSIGASASASVLPVNIQAWFPLGLTGLISLDFIS